MALEIIAYDPNEATETVDGIKVSANLLHIAHCRADRAHKTHFIGVVDQKNPEFKEADPSSMSDLAEFVGMSTISRMIEARYVTTAYVLSDDRDEVLLHGCGRLVWVPPGVTPAKEVVGNKPLFLNQPTAEQTKHTPGPWTQHSISHEELRLVGAAENSFHAADITIGSGEKIIGELVFRKHTLDQRMLGYPHVDDVEELKANAALVFAAPDMLTTLRDVLAFLQDGPGLSDGHSLVSQVQATINKAEGRE